MRKINYGLMSMLTLLMCAITSCGDAERPSYEGPNYILFSDTLTVLAVQNNEEVFDIPVAATEDGTTTAIDLWGCQDIESELTVVIIDDLWQKVTVLLVRP
jgi:hypothetical protein